jgi:hypothetical protein
MGKAACYTADMIAGCSDMSGMTGMTGCMPAAFGGAAGRNAGGLPVLLGDAECPTEQSCLATAGTRWRAGSGRAAV